MPPPLNIKSSLGLLPVALIAFVPPASAQAPQTFTPKAIVQFAPGGDRERAVLSRMPGLAELIKGQFGLGGADLNGDGKNEIVVVSLTCDSVGCPVVVIEDNAGRAAPIFARKVAGRLAITNEKLNGYYALAAADKAGAIIKDPSTGKQLVYVVGANAQGAAANSAPSAAACSARSTAGCGSHHAAAGTRRHTAAPQRPDNPLRKQTVNFYPCVYSRGA